MWNARREFPRRDVELRRCVCFNERRPYIAGKTGLPRAVLEPGDEVTHQMTMRKVEYEYIDL
jgi:hypothetical protein